MASMICRCGNRMSTTAAPNNVQLRVYTDREWDALVSKDILQGWKLPLPRYDVWRCPACGRIYVFDPPQSRPVAVYVREGDTEEQ